jgi:hypothetical protein
MIAMLTLVICRAHLALAGDVDRLDEIDSLRQQALGLLEKQDCQSDHMTGGFRYIFDRDWVPVDPASSLAKSPKSLEDVVAGLEARLGQGRNGFAWGQFGRALLRRTTKSPVQGITKSRNRQITQ